MWKYVLQSIVLLYEKTYCLIKCLTELTQVALDMTLGDPITFGLADFKINIVDTMISAVQDFMASLFLN